MAACGGNAVCEVPCAEKHIRPTKPKMNMRETEKAPACGGFSALLSTVRGLLSKAWDAPANGENIA